MEPRERIPPSPPPNYLAINYLQASCFHCTWVFHPRHGTPLVSEASSISRSRERLKSLSAGLTARQRDGRLERQGRPVLGVRSPHSRLTTSNSRERSAGPSRTAAARPRDMTIKRSDHVSVVVDDLAAAIAFFTALCMTLPAATSATCDDCRSRPMPRRSRRWVLYTPGFLLSGHTGAPLVPEHFRFGRRPSLATELTLCR